MALRRVLTTSDAAWIVAANMIGAGIFITPGFVAAGLPGLGWPLLAWLLGGALALAGAAVYAELGARLPHAGGDYQYLRHAFGPLAAFLMGWAAITLTFSAAAAAMARVAAAYVGGQGLGVTLGAPAVVLALTAANAAGVRVAGRASMLLTATPIVLLLALFAHGALSGAEDLAWPERFLAPTRGPWPLALGAAMVPVFFTYSGWNAAAYLAGELRHPDRSLPRALLGGSAAVTALYLLINLTLLAVLGDGLGASATPVADAVGRLLGPGARRLLGLIVAAAVVGSANVTLVAGARVYYAMAVDGLAPHRLGRVSGRGVPASALWCGGLWSALLASLAAVETLYSWATLAILLLSALTVSALFVLRRRPAGAPSFRCPGHPLPALVYLAASLGVAVASAIREPRQALAGVAIVAAGFPVYALWRR